MPADRFQDERDRPPDTGGAPTGSLTVVATPIGNLGDLPPRATDALATADLILAEDTRRTRKLLSHFHISTPTRAFHEHNERKELPTMIRRLEGGARIALVTDAGMPAVADPGFRLVRACHERGVAVTVVPGPSAVTTALALSGLPPMPFTFGGFLPARGGPRTTMLETLAAVPHTLVVFLSPHRLGAELADAARILGEHRDGALCAELTKMNERCLRGTLAQLAASPEAEAPRGEYTLVVGPPEPEAPAEVSPEAARQALEDALATGLPLAEARRAAARRLAISRRQLYEMLMPPRE